MAPLIVDAELARTKVTDAGLMSLGRFENLRALDLTRTAVSSAGLEVVGAPTGSIDYDVDEWMAHGGPSAEAAAEIVRLFEASLETDRCGLAVRREGGRLRFSHRVASFLLRPA